MKGELQEIGGDVIVGSGDYRYRIVTDWAKLPPGWDFKNAAAVVVDKADRVYVFNRSEHPMMIFDRDGNLLSTWGEGVCPRAHGLSLGPDETIYCTDDGDQTVRKCTLDGKILLEIGIPGKAAPEMSGLPFNHCTHTALSPRGDIYISDGYGNARVHKYSPGGKLIKSWGASGSEPGEFNLPHNILCDKDGWVYVADRENHRIQVFDGDGNYEAQWNNLFRPCALMMTDADDPLCFIGELPAASHLSKGRRRLGSCIKIATMKGEVLARLGDDLPGTRPGQFISPHGIAVDSHGDMYISEVPYGMWAQLFDEPRPEVLRCLQKWVRI